MIKSVIRFSAVFGCLLFSLFLCVHNLAAAIRLYPVEVPNRTDNRSIELTGNGATAVISPLKAGSFRVYPLSGGRVSRRSGKEVAIIHDTIPGETVYSNFIPYAIGIGSRVGADTAIGEATDKLHVINRIRSPLVILQKSVHYHIPQIAIVNPCVDEKHLSMVSPVVKIIDGYVESQIRVLHYLELKSVDLSFFDCVIITGQSNPWEEYSMSDFAQIASILEKGEVPVLGICGGHQLIALLNGVRVDLVKPGCDKTKGYAGCFKVRGPVEVELLEQTSIFYGQSPKRTFFASHCEDIKSLPKGFVQIARSELSEYYAMRHVTKQQYGVQFHPELGNIADSEKVIEQFVYIAINREDRAVYGKPE